MNYWQVTYPVPYQAAIILSRPAKLNAFTFEDIQHFDDVITELTENKIRVVWLYGSGNNFSSGLDLPSSIQQIAKFLSSPNVKDALLEQIISLQKILMRWYHAPFISVALIDGYCIGGAMELASLCDIRFATQKAKFCLKELAYGIIPDLGGMTILPKIIGESNVRFLALTTETVSADWVYHHQFLHHAPFENFSTLQEYAQNLTEKILGIPIFSQLIYAKKVLNGEASAALENLAAKNAEVLSQKEFIKLLSTLKK